MAREKFDYNKWMQQNFEELIDALAISDLRKKIVKRRWLDQMNYLEKKAGHARRRFYAFRVIAVLGGISLPVLTALPLPEVGALNLAVVLASLIGGVVAAAGAMEGLFRYNDQWLQSRQSAEMLKIEGWSFFSLSGEYAEHGDHSAAFPEFAGRVEDIIRMDVRSFVAKMAKKKEGEEEGGGLFGKAGEPKEDEALESHAFRP